MTSKTSFYAQSGATPTEQAAIESSVNTSAASAAAAAISATAAATSAAAASANVSDNLASAAASEASRVASVAAQAASETAKTASETAQAAALVSKNAASTSATNAASSETSVSNNTATSTTKAAEAAASATASEASKVTSVASAATATTKASESATSATSSASSATASEASRVASVAAKTASETAETSAETAEAAALVSKNAAASSATASEASKVTSVASASTATTKASEASTSESNSATSASSASTSASTATSKAADSETARAASVVAKDASVVAKNSSVVAKDAAVAAQAAAETAETNAETAETNSASSASGASTSAATATTKASEAAASASSSETFKVASEAAKDAALAALDSFDDRYLGSKSSAPTVDNDGDALVSGMLYFNTTTNEMKVYDGSRWLNAYASLSGALLATSNLSDLNNAGTARTNLGLGTAATTAASAYATAAQGTKVDGIEALATVTNTASVTAAGALMDSELTSIVAVKALNQGVATGDSPDFAALNVDGTATVDGLTVSSSTSTNATFVNGVGTGMQLTLADQGWSAGINQNAGSLYLQSGGLTNRLGIASNGDISFYEPTGNAKFFWDASAESLGIGTSSPSASLHVSASPEIVTRLSRSAGSNSLVLFEDPTTTLAPYIGSYGNAMAFGRYGGGESMRIDSSGTVLVGTTSAGSAGAGDIVVSGGVYLGGTGAANRLDSYETGNWTPSFNYGGLSSALGTYTKIGNLVTLKMYVTFNVAGSTSNFMNIAGFPFAINSSAVNYGPSTVMMDNLSTAYNNVVIQPSVGSSSAIFIVNNLSTSTHSGMQASNFTASTSVRATIIYTTDS